MELLVEKFPEKKILELNWYQAAIAHLLLFKYLKQKYSNHAYFLISQQGIRLKATSLSVLKSVEDQINKFFTAKIEQLQIQTSSDFYEHLIQDIKQQTDKLKDARDCPYINLVYSEKLKISCLAMKKYGYSKPYRNWQSNQREKRGFCFLIVRPDHRWKQIANNVMTLVKKRQNLHQKHQKNKSIWPIELCYESFIWLFLREQFLELKPYIEIRQQKEKSIVRLLINGNLNKFQNLKHQLNQLIFSYQSKKIDVEKQSICLSAFELQKITQLVYHEFGLPNVVRDLRKRICNYLVIGPDLIDTTNFPENNILDHRDDMKKIKQNDFNLIFKLGNRHQIVNFKNTNFVMVKFDSPLKENILQMLKIRLPCFPRYYYWFEKNNYIFMLRRYQVHKFKLILQQKSIFQQIELINSLICIVNQLHHRSIYLGKKFPERVFLELQRIIIEPSEVGCKAQDDSKLKGLVQDWLTTLPQSDLQIQLNHLTNLQDIQKILDIYIDEHT